MTNKTRINITAEKEVEEILKKLASKSLVPVATKAAQLLSVGLALEEDIALANIADMRTYSKARFIPHEKIWK